MNVVKVRNELDYAIGRLGIWPNQDLLAETEYGDVYDIESIEVHNGEVRLNIKKKQYESSKENSSKDSD